jgi:hypothetical protein
MSVYEGFKTRVMFDVMKVMITMSAIAVFATIANADTWRGTAPFCDGKCLAGETQMAINDTGDGGYCLTGHKVLCRNSQPTCVPRQTITTCYALVDVCDNGFCEATTSTWHSCDKFACGVCFGKSPSSTSSSDPCVGSSTSDLTGSESQTIKLSIELARFAAIWEKRPKVEWIARHGMTSSQYQQEFTAFGKLGYRLINISGYGLNDQGYYAAIWERSSGPARVAHHGMTSAQYQKEFDEFGKQGYRLVNISGYTVSGQDHYAAIWEKSSGPAWVAHHGMTSAQYQKEFDELGKQGYRLVDISGYTVSGQDRYAAIWEKKSGLAWVARHGMTADQYQNGFDELSKQGYHITRISGWEVPGASHYAAIWEKNSNPAQVARHGMSSDQYQKEFDRLTRNGYRLIDVSGYGSTEQ